MRLAYLILYNLMFIIPLLMVFGCVYWGTTSMQLGGVLQRHLMPVKLGYSGAVVWTWNLVVFKCNLKDPKGIIILCTGPISPN